MMNDIPTGLTSAQGLNLNAFEQISTSVQSWRNDNGTRVMFVETRGLPIVDIKLRFKAGTSADQDHHGLAAVTLHMLDKGSDGLEAAERDRRMQELGAIVSKDIRLDHATFSLRTLSAPEILTPAVTLLASMLAHPDFPADALKTIKTRVNAQDGAWRKSQHWQPVIELYHHLYQGHPYESVLSTPEHVDALTVDDLKAFHRKAYCASNLDIAIVGDLSREAAVALAQDISSALPQGWTAAHLPPVPSSVAATRHLPWSVPNILAQLTLPMNVPPTEAEHLPLQLANEVLGGGFSSRLMQELRQRLELTYHIDSDFTASSTAGRLSIRWDVKPQHLQTSVERVDALLLALAQEGPTLEELQLAQQRLAGKCLKEVATNGQLAERLAYLASHDLPDDYLDTYTDRLREQTPAVVHEVIRRRFDLDRKILITVGGPADQQPLAPSPSDQ
ncbi:pitrilysin family protein [uncultured Pseudomonas sp.]|uniref:M16 family metallopeptidase n=1 Tax=uncultured Pseudomonas sp. TaxID=114707 RepID=UPI00258E0E15|nr:pitrilysin family protein [uncultured Pseudomonas sp.]